jgi:TusA-related sulfurtransferase
MLMAKKAMQAASAMPGGQENKIKVLVDCAASVENIGRAAKQLGWELTVLSRQGDEAELELSKK